VQWFNQLIACKARCCCVYIHNRFQTGLLRKAVDFATQRDTSEPAAMHALDFAAQDVARVVLRQRLLPIFQVKAGGNESGNGQIADCYGNRHGLLLFRLQPSCKAGAADDDEEDELGHFYSAEGLMRRWGEGSFRCRGDCMTGSDGACRLAARMH